MLFFRGAKILKQASLVLDACPHDAQVYDLQVGMVVLFHNLASFLFT